jgi:hypothetical protein
MQMLDPASQKATGIAAATQLYSEDSTGIEQAHTAMGTPQCFFIHNCGCSWAAAPAQVQACLLPN